MATGLLAGLILPPEAGAAGEERFPLCAAAFSSFSSCTGSSKPLTLIPKEPQVPPAAPPASPPSPSPAVVASWATKIGAALPAQLLAPGYRDPSILIKFQRGRRSLWSLLLSLLQLSALLAQQPCVSCLFFFQAQSQGLGACLIKQPQHRLLT